MDLYIERNELARGLARVQGIVERRSTSPLLSHVLLHAHSDGLRMTATDTEVAFIGELAANVEVPGELAVDAAGLFQRVRSLPEPTVRLRTQAGNRLEVTSGRTKFTIAGVPAEEYPPLPAFDAQGSATIAASELRRLVEQTAFSVATDDARYGLNGVHVEEVPGDAKAVRFVATDGHRLSAAEASYEGELALSPRMLVPRKALAVLRKLLDGGDDSVELAFGEGMVRLSRPGQIFWFRLLDGEFPDYRAVLPGAAKHRAVLRRDEFAASLKRAGIVAQDRTRAVRFAFGESELAIEVKSVDRGDAYEELTVELEGEPIEMGFNVRYLIEILSVLSGEHVQLEMTHNLGPCLVKSKDDDSAFFVVMPMRLD